MTTKIFPVADQWEEKSLRETLIKIIQIIKVFFLFFVSFFSSRTPEDKDGPETAAAKRTGKVAQENFPSSASPQLSKLIVKMINFPV